MNFIEKQQRAKKLIKESLSKYPKNCVAVSFGKDSVVLLHLIKEVAPDIPVFAVLSNTEFDETYEYRDFLKKEWNINYVEHQFKNDRQNGAEDCCRSKKVETFKKALKDYDCWFSGIRRDEGFTREDFEEVDCRGKLVKVNPILHFTEKDIWRYLALHEIRVNPIYKKGYRSLSCKHCSVPEEHEDEVERAGRWKGSKAEGSECGIHTQKLK